LQERCEDYQGMGVEIIWIIDPKTRSGRMCLGDDWIAAPALEVPGMPISLDLVDLFSRFNVQAE
jgi:Uma2 family endonuclease